MWDDGGNTHTIDYSDYTDRHIHMYTWSCLFGVIKHMYTPNVTKHSYIHTHTLHSTHTHIL